ERREELSLSTGRPSLSGVLSGPQRSWLVPSKTPPERPEPANLSIADDVHARLTLLADNFGCHGPHPRAECLAVIGLALLDCPYCLRHIRRTGEPAGMCRKDAVRAALHGLPPYAHLSICFLLHAAFQVS